MDISTTNNDKVATSTADPNCAHNEEKNNEFEVKNEKQIEEETDLLSDDSSDDEDSEDYELIEGEQLDDDNSDDDYGIDEYIDNKQDAMKRTQVLHSTPNYVQFSVPLSKTETTFIDIDYLPDDNNNDSNNNSTSKLKADPPLPEEKPQLFVEQITIPLELSLSSNTSTTSNNTNVIIDTKPQKPIQKKKVERKKTKVSGSSGISRLIENMEHFYSQGIVSGYDCNDEWIDDSDFNEFDQLDQYGEESEVKIPQYRGYYVHSGPLTFISASYENYDNA